MYALQASEQHQHSLSAQFKQRGLIHTLAETIESTWQSNLNLSPYTVPKELGYIEGHLDGDVLTISNRCYSSTVFRKLHLELARIGNKLDILHCVMFPKPQYELPIFGTDIVVSPRGVSAAIVDLSPVTSDLSLPENYSTALSALKPAQFSECRQLPEWGDIFSRFCLFIRPTTEEEEFNFLTLVCDYLGLHCNLSISAKPVSPELQTEVLSGQSKYCRKQRSNDKTRRILEKSFGTEWTSRYMEDMLFDIQ